MMSLLVAGLVFIAIVGLGLTLASGPSRVSSKRIKQVRQTRSQRAAVSASEQMAKKRRALTTDALKSLSAQDNKARRERVSVKGMLRQAGLDIPLSLFWLACLGVGVALGVTVLVLGLPLPIAGAALFAGGLGLPRQVLKMLIANRQKKFSTQLADGIEVIVRGVKSGLPLNQCLQIIAKESPKPLSGEFQRLIDGQAMGVPLEQNLQRFHDRMPLPEVNFFNTVILIQQKSGGNLSEALGNLAGVLRTRKLMKEKIKALSGEAVASAGIIGSLPPLVGVLVYIIQPDYISILFTRTEGQIAISAGAVWMFMGIMTMRKMINFKF